MHIHILGICGTFMGSLAVLAKQLGFTVSGSDQQVYPPMSSQLESQGIELIEGYDPQQLASPEPDLVVIGNVMARGNPCVEYVLNHNLPYMSGPQWLAEYVLKDRWVLAVSGTHGKTTTTSMLAWILEYAQLQPGFLIGGVAKNFASSARLGSTPFFVVEADEYDSAFFDKRSKFVHYRPRTLIINNLEFDHADIFPDLASIQTQFHHLLRMLPEQGLLIHPNHSQAIEQTLEQGLWSQRESFQLGKTLESTTPRDDLGILKGQWRAQLLKPDGSCFELFFGDQLQGRVEWQINGDFNVCNAMAAIAAARHAGVPVRVACEALGQFSGVKRRLELRAEVNKVCIYDDFAHHPTAIAATLKAFVAKLKAESADRSTEGRQPRIIAVLEPRSNSMRMGSFQEQLPLCCNLADVAYWFQPSGLDWDLNQVVSRNHPATSVFNDVDRLVNTLVEQSQPGDNIIIMSNGGFGGIHDKLIQALADRQAS